MAYKALYRKYRPETFESVVGQQHITKTLQNAILQNKVAHAYLFSGPRGTGKTTTAKLLAKDQAVVIKKDAGDLTITAAAADTTGTAKETVHYFVVYLNEETETTDQSKQMGAKYEGQLIYTTTTGGNTLTGTFTA